MRSSNSELSVQSEDNPFPLASQISFSFKEFTEHHNKSLPCERSWEGQCFRHLRFSVYIIIVTSADMQEPVNYCKLLNPYPFLNVHLGGQVNLQVKTLSKIVVN
jgi:hypothetical protein